MVCRDVQQDVDVVERATRICVKDVGVGSLTRVTTDQQEVHTTFDGANVWNLLIVGQGNTGVCAARDVPESNPGNRQGRNEHDGKSCSDETENGARPLDGCNSTMTNGSTSRANASLA